jgi:cleavage and polyadenylation specificity factor subunit 3
MRLTREVELLLITHFHIDHCAAVPWFLIQTGFKGKCSMTHSAKGIFKILLSDYVGVTGCSSNQSLFNKSDLDNSLLLIFEVNYYQVITSNGIKLSCYNAGHVFGACM